jgi:hypothetical protein
MGQALGGHMRRHKQQQADAPACAEVVAEVEVGQQKEDAVDSSGAPPLEDRRGGDIREGCSSGMGQVLGGHVRRYQQHAVAASVDVDEERRNEEEALNSSCQPPLEDRRGGDREGCTSGSGSGSGPEPRLLNLLV